MKSVMKWTMVAAVALSASAAWGQAAYTGKEALKDNKNAWIPGTYGTASPEVSLTTGTFHAGGVAACDGCHVMHNASKGVARSTKVAPWTNAVPAFLLQGSDQSSTCLNCHGDAAHDDTKPYVIANTGTTGGINFSPGGDFGWLKETTGYLERSGHNVVASDFSMSFDGSMKQAPGGTFAPGSGLAAFACSNCHDPHGRYRMQGAGAKWNWAGPVVQAGLVQKITQPIWASGSYGELPTDTKAVGAYRLLAGVGYSPASNIASPFPFVSNPPVAVAPTAYNQAEKKGTEVRVAYGAGMSEWCANCHTNIHMDNYVSGAQGGTGLKHPAGALAVLKPGQYNVYNTYVSSGKFDGTGDQYTSLVPFENAAKIGATASGGNIADLTKLKDAAQNSLGITNGIFVATAQSNVMCLSCHRAHASGFTSMVRWNPDDTFITNSTANFVDTKGGRSGVLSNAYNGRTPADFGTYQRSMCNKCHGKD
jgi:hypothetical protein